MSAWLRLKGSLESASPASRTPSWMLSPRSENWRPTAAPAIAKALASSASDPNRTVAGGGAVGEAMARQPARRRAQHGAQQQRDDHRQHDDAQVRQRVGGHRDRGADGEQPPGDRRGGAQPARDGVAGVRQSGGGPAGGAERRGRLDRLDRLGRRRPTRLGRRRRARRRPAPASPSAAGRPPSRASVVSGPNTLLRPADRLLGRNALGVQPGNVRASCSQPVPVVGSVTQTPVTHTPGT